MPPGRTRGRPPNQQSAAPEAQSSMARRSTRHQQQQQQPQPQPLPEEMNDKIDPNLTNQGESMPPPPFVQPAQRFTRAEQHVDNMRSSVMSQPQSSQSYTSGIPDPDHLVLSGSGRSSQPRHSTPAGTPRPGSLARSLPLLERATDEYFTHLKKFSPSEDMNVWRDDTLAWKLPLDGYRNFFLENSSSPTIDARAMVRQINFDPESLEALRATRVFLATNFVTLLEEIVSLQDSEADINISYTLEGWDKDFPKRFFLEVPSSELAHDIIFHVLEIRTQILICKLEARRQTQQLEPGEATEEAYEVFCNRPLSDVELTAYLNDGEGIDNFQPRDIEGIDLESDVSKDQYMSRVRSIFGTLRSHGTLDDSNYELHSTLSGLRDFVEEQFANLKRGSSAQPAGSDTSRLGEAQQIQTQLESEAMEHERVSTELGILAHDPRYAREYQALRQTEPDSTRLATQDIINKSNQIQPSVYPPGGSLYQYGTYVGSQPSGAIYAQSAAQVSGVKRPAPDGFENPSQPAKKTRVRRKKPAAPPAQGTETTPAGATPGAMVPVPGPDYPVPPGSQIEPDFEAVAQRSKELSAASRKAREPQVRSAWVQPDIGLLVKAVDTYKCKWSVIEKAITNGTIPFKRPRDQQALRDKARLLKQDLLKADAVLPPSFDLVVLGKKERAAVMACGKNPDRKEADVDAAGNAINTEYQEEGLGTAA